MYLSCICAIFNIFLQFFLLADVTSKYTCIFLVLASKQVQYGIVGYTYDLSFRAWLFDDFSMRIAVFIN